VKLRKKAATVKYTLPEVVRMIAAMQRTDAKLVCALCCLAGLMPGEAAAVRWENINGNVLSILESAPSGHLGELKSEYRKGSVLLISPIMRLLEVYRIECGKATGFLFAKNGKPVNMNYFASDFIKPFARAVIGDRWAGLYAARRACGTLLYNLTGDSRASFQVLRNTAAIAEDHYIGPDIKQGRSGQLLLEQAFEVEAARGEKQ
jgi:integrase